MSRKKPEDDFYSEQEKKWQDAAAFKGIFASKSDSSCGTKSTTSKQ